MLKKISDLRDALESDSRVLKLAASEKQMESSDEIMRLAYSKDIAETAYNDAIRHFGEDSPDVRHAQKALFKAKTELDSHPLVRDYLASYRDVRLLYERINDELFSPFIDHICEEHK